MLAYMTDFLCNLQLPVAGYLDRVNVKTVGECTSYVTPSSRTVSPVSNLQSVPPTHSATIFFQFAFNLTWFASAEVAKERHLHKTWHIIFYILLTVHLGTNLVNNQLDAQFLCIYFTSLHSFEQLRAHHQENQLYQYNIWCMSLCV
jgi:hypothetical protein